LWVIAHHGKLREPEPTPLLVLTIGIIGETLQTMNLDDACRYLGHWSTGNGDMRATKEVVIQKIIAAGDLNECHPPTPELTPTSFTSKVMAVFRFSAALHEWSESE